MTAARTDQNPAGPWGRAVGLLTACLTTLLGVWRGLEPVTILWRSFVAAVVVGLLVSAALSIGRYLVHSSR